MANKIRIKNARLSFPSVFKRSVFNGEEGKFEATFLFPKSDTDTYDKIMAEIEAMKKANKSKVSPDKLCIKSVTDLLCPVGRIAVNHNNLMIIIRQHFSQMCTYFTCSCNYYFHFRVSNFSFISLRLIINF